MQVPPGRSAQPMRGLLVGGRSHGRHEDLLGTHKKEEEEADDDEGEERDA